jgi:hypothetical protein
MAIPRAKTKPAPLKSRPAARKPTPAAPPAKPKLPAALAQRAKALHDAAQARLVEQGREAIALIRDRREAIADDYFDVGRALITLKSEAVALALGYGDVAAMLRAELDLSVATANKLIELATRVDRSLLRELQQERAAAILALVDATPEDDTVEDLLAAPFPLPEGGGTLDLRTAPVAEITAAARALRQQHAPATKRAAGFTTTPAERKAFNALVAPVTKHKTLRGVATFKLVASRGAHGPLVESRIPLSEFERVTALLHQRR